MRALITGGHGFAGRHLAKHLVSCGDTVALTYFPQKMGGDGVNEQNQVKLPNACQSMALDISDIKAIEQLVAVLKPDVIYHLAAQTFVPDGERDFNRVFSVNTFGTINLLEAAVKHAPDTRVLLVSSSEVYGEPRAGSLPLNENSPMRPISAYGVSKAGADLAGFKYSFRENLHVVRVRPFPHVGPGQNERFAISSFAKQVAGIKLGKAKPVIKVGNLQAKRDYTDVSDIVRGYREASLNGIKGEAYNLCSGSSVEISEMLQILIKLAGVGVEVSVDPALVRDVDITDLCGSHEKAQKDFGWKPRVEREAMLDGLLAYWLEVLGG